MGLPVTVYRWDDAGAPQLTTGKPSELIDILKKCLVTGYGAKAALGWSIAFEDAPTFKVAFRNSTADGSGGYVQFWSINGLDTNNNDIRLRACAGMSALDTFVKSGIQQQFKIATTMKFWVLIGTSAGFYLMFNYRTTSPLCLSNDGPTMFVGDIDTTIVSDAGRFISVMTSTTSDMTSSNYTYRLEYQITNNVVIGKMYDADGDSSFVNVYTAPGVFVNSASVTGEIGAIANFKPIIIHSSNSSQDVLDRLGIKQAYSVTRPFIRGKFPGVLKSLQSAYSDQTWPLLLEINTQDYFLMPGWINTQWWINTVEWYE
ncbi:hypothetical protein L2744_00315 [Shewanella profunda]|uniref:hypothetical protein n=1 Tax=Shewanella profunda TaxID=254793 RepID=UPI00200F260F|nr:hypothetical protein [Shewanella profunda]MCL1088076.1 hypothetical protein [Shewanella profunda]